jgi:flagellar motor protein MotB
MSQSSTDRKYGFRSIVGLLIFLGCVGLVVFDSVVRLGAAGPDMEIAFTRGLSTAGDFDDSVMEIVRRMQAETDLIVTLRGHTGTLGDADINKELGRDRAQKVKDSIVAQGIVPGRVSVIGVGGEEPLPQENGESGRVYQRRLARVQAVFEIGGAR